MPSEKLDQLTVLNKDASLDGISVKQQANGRGSALRVDSDTTTAPALLVQGAGTLLDLRNASGASQFSVDNDGDLTFSGALTPDSLDLTGAATTTDMITVDVTGDTQRRLIVNAGGGLDWGSGSATVDTNLYRGDADILQTDDTFRIGAAATLQLGATGDTNLYRAGASSLMTDDAFTVAGATTLQSTVAITGATTLSSTVAQTVAATTTDAVSIKVTGDTNQRLIANGDGGLEWGPGNAATDTTLYRSAANTLKTDDALVVASELTAGVGGYRLPVADFGPQDHGLEAWTHDPYTSASSAIAIAGRVYLVRLNIRRAVTVDTIHWVVGTAGNTPTAGQNEVGLYSSAGTLLAATNVDTAISSTGSKSTAITAQALTAGTFVWVGFVFNAALSPTLLRGSSFESSPSINLTAATLRAAVNGDAATVLAASITPSSNSTSNCLTYFAAVSE